MRRRCGCARSGHSIATDRFAAGPPTPGGPASVALLGVRFQLSLEGGKLGKRRVGIGLLIALATRGVIAAVLVLVAVFHEAGALRTILLAFRTNMLPLAPLTAVVALAPLRATSTTMLRGGLFDRRASFDHVLGAALRRDGALRR